VTRGVYGAARDERKDCWEPSLTVIFTSGGSEASNQALEGAVFAVLAKSPVPETT
jgi:cysteine sulfinate desulfinase/cysteine desulfurase-like protein